ncbi:hypothetical protein [Desulfobaculum bizertense]|uniref:Uncharacterized protein n=1 Tax=Desulfobaculum bizertense DSM 18034 TaxID=1121442 RepID=A0A1T4VIN2_9BACT|nr:hypothetical protein [Desulfobaculum bizertense]UIJ37936.1 hypothetical protein LWC08_14755 [Desulfobaculum bizertense]SKA64814.1 hypothetical protein SAMN02745702_00413 [Desulfobaculum bizertense DSM 18034]
MGQLKKNILIAVLCVFAFASLGMGGLGDSRIIKKIPEPDRHFLVKIVDIDDVSYSVTDFSVEGLTLIPVKIGRADASIDLADIRSAKFFRRGSSIVAQVEMKKGGSKSLAIDPAVTFYGRTSWGLLRLKAEDLREVHVIRRLP